MAIETVAFDEEMAALVERVQVSLVQIIGTKGSLGAGIVWRSDGLIVTNAHVVQEENLEVVLADGSRFLAQIVFQDPALDLALLSIAADGLQPIRLGDSQSVRAGQWVVAIGHPYGLLGAATAGSVIAAGADLPERGSDRDWIALNLRLRPGHSGGPLVDAQGNLLGINTFITGPEVGFAIPTHVISEVIQARHPEVQIVSA
ncbi:MAG: trypsin-like peptidase domain-containing protein [Chloroflexi bacterium]|nr:trypsin-like peptidase domain-containing protein [Chloroflexota bacterium]